MAKTIAVVSADQVGYGISIPRDLAKALDVKPGDYLLIEANKRKTVAVATSVLGRTGIAVIGKQIASLLNLKEIDLIEITKPPIEEASKVIVKLEDNQDIEDTYITRYLLGKIVLHGSTLEIPRGRTRIKARILIELGDKNKIYMISHRTTIHIVAEEPTRGREGEKEKTVIREKKNIDRELRKEFMEKLQKIGFSIADIDSIFIKACKPVDNLLYEIWIAWPYLDRVIVERDIEEIDKNIKESLRLPNLTIILAKDVWDNAVAKARQHGYIILALGNNRNKAYVAEAVAEKIKAINTALAKGNKGITVKLKTAYIGLRNLIDRVNEENVEAAT